MSMINYYNLEDVFIHFGMGQIYPKDFGGLLLSNLPLSESRKKGVHNFHGVKS